LWSGVTEKPQPKAARHFFAAFLENKPQGFCAFASPYNKTSDVFSPEYKANTSRRIDFSADVITNTSSNIRLYTAFAMHIERICPNITIFTVLTY